MVEPHGDDRLAAEPLHRLLVDGELGQEDLDGDLAVALEVAGEIDVRHPALTDQGIDAVATVEGLAGEIHVQGTAPGRFGVMASG